MSYRTILAHFDPTEEASARLRLAVDLAQVFDAGLGAWAFDAWPDPTGVSFEP